jgi:L-amino acid N-acyltransferase YncA
MKIREATEQDFEQIWPIFREIVAAGETYAYAPDTTKEQALRIWIEVPRKTFVVEEAGNTLGTSYIKTNQQGPGDHVCNCGYMVSSTARGRGLATAMCEHSQDAQRSLDTKPCNSIL